MIIDIQNKKKLSHFEKKLLINSLSQNQIIAFPTDTIYGFGINGFSNKAMHLLYDLKKRDENKPLVLLSDTIQKITHFLDVYDEAIQKIMEDNWPGPVTLILPAKNPSKLQYCIYPKDTLAIRIPKYPLLLDFLSSLPFPLLTTSANLSNQEPLNCAEIIEETFLSKNIYLTFILDGGVLQGKPSAIISIDKNGLTNLRS